MTRFGALNGPGPLIAGEYSCICPVCSTAAEPRLVFENVEALTLHNLWTIHDTMTILRKMRGDDDALARYPSEVVAQHAWFPDSDLEKSWSELNETA